jgi:hypothetical protein
MSRELKFGDKFRKLPLIKWRFGEYENYPELEWTKIDVEVNEHPVLKGKVGYLKSALSHHEYRGLEQYIYKHNIYSTHEAKRYIWLTSPLGEEYWNAFGFRQKIKYKLLDKYWLCLIYFFYSYFLKLGFLDGVPGFAFHTVKLRTLFDTALKIRDFQGKGMLASSLIDSDFKQNMPISNGP